MTKAPRRLPLSHRFTLIMLLCLVVPVAILLGYLNWSLGNSLRESRSGEIEAHRRHVQAWQEAELARFRRLVRVLGESDPAHDPAMAERLAALAGAQVRIPGTELPADAEPSALVEQRLGARSGPALVEADGGLYWAARVGPVERPCLVYRRVELAELGWPGGPDIFSLTVLDLSTHRIVHSTLPEALARDLAVGWWIATPSVAALLTDSRFAPVQGLESQSLALPLGDGPDTPFLAVIAAGLYAGGALDISKPVLVVSSMIILMILISSLLLTRGVIGPIISLSYAVESLRLHLRQHGPLMRITLRRNDEIGDLALAINELGQELGVSSSKIAEQRSEIVAYTHSLEERVQERTRDLEEARLRAEIANQHKSKFLVNMNHELRTPLNAISGITELLRYGAYEKHEDVAAILEGLAGHAALAALPGRRELFERVAADLQADSGAARILLDLLAEGFEALPEPDRETLRGELERAAALVDEEERQRFKAYNNIHDAGVSLLRIIDEVINLSRIESGVITIEPTRVRLAEIVASCQVHAEAYAHHHGKFTQLRISHAIDPEVPEYVRLDGQKVKQVLLNLLTNAVKYTEHGQIQLQLSLRREGDKDFLLCSVKDTGRGISDKDRSVMFMEFGRSFEVREIEGTGLGLALSKKLVERHGGSMGFSSELGRGSTFWFTVPLASAEDGEPGQLDRAGSAG